MNEGRTVGPKTTMASVREEPEEKKKNCGLTMCVRESIILCCASLGRKRKVSENYKYK